MRVFADSTRCMGSGYCTLTAPDLFDVDDDGMVLLRDENPPESMRASVEKAVERCPVQALRISDD